MTAGKVFVFAFITFCVFFFNHFFDYLIDPTIGMSVGVEQFERGETMTPIRTWEHFKGIVDITCAGIVVLSGVVLFSGPLFRKLRKVWTS